ncbi:hypothetical protein MRY87_05105 [bacterium]|nr:hypothetical protein [bacterium]
MKQDSVLGLTLLGSEVGQGERSEGGEHAAERLEARLDGRVRALMGEGAFSEGDILFVKSFRLPAGSGSLQVSQELLERLRNAAQIWDVSLKPQTITSHRPVVGPLIVAAKRLVFPIIALFLKDTLRQQRDFNAAVLRCLVEISGEKGRER